MQSEYNDLLDATISHLEGLKQRGQQYVLVEKATLDGLNARPTVAAPARTPVAQQRVVAPISVTPTPTAATPQKRVLEPVTVTGDLSTSEGKEAAMAELRCLALQCQKCPNLASSRKNVVFGVGTIHTELMFVGEAPGADEDIQGEPFVGKAGQLLTKIIKTMNFSRDTVYIANVLKCRPDTPGQAFGNRKPTPEEMETCLPFLLAQIEIIKPKIIVALGATAMEGLFGKPIPINKARGTWQTFRNIPVMPTFHPAYLLRNQALTEKRKVWEDMLQVLEKLDRPISEKQRGYFRSAV